MKDNKDKYKYTYEPQNRGLTYRTTISSTLNTKLFTALNELADKTRIPKSRLLDEAVQDLLIKHKGNTLP